MDIPKFPYTHHTGKSQLVQHVLRKKQHELNQRAKAEYGFIIHYIFPNSTTDADGGCIDYNTYTEGLTETYGHTELQLCAPVRGETAYAIMWNCVNLIKDGHVFTDKELNISIGNMPVYFIKVNANLLRIILPDIHGKWQIDKMELGYRRQYEAFPEMFEEIK